MSTPCESPRPLRHVLAGLLIPTALTLTACSPPVNATGELGQDQAILATCAGQQLAEMVTIDDSGTGRDQSIADQHLGAVRTVVRRTAICGGHLRVTAFAGTSAVTRPLYDGELQLAGATDIARLRKVPALVEDVMSTVSKGYQAALAAPPAGDGSDITGQYRLAGEYADQLGKGYTLEFVLLTDGFQTNGADAIDHALSSDEAKRLAAKVNLPTLKGATVTVAGLGRVVGTPPQSDMVEGLVRFYDAVCARTGAAKCTSVTDFTVGR
jgi:hypothetical protein